ncbi:MAG: hypothetical protein Kow0047_00900 [Anaerolineae bacterium]
MTVEASIARANHAALTELEADSYERSDEESRGDVLWRGHTRARAGTPGVGYEAASSMIRSMKRAAVHP